MIPCDHVDGIYADHHNKPYLSLNKSISSSFKNTLVGLKLKTDDSDCKFRPGHPTKKQRNDDGTDLEHLPRQKASKPRLNPQLLLVPCEHKVCLNSKEKHAGILVDGNATVPSAINLLNW